jgi:hypothetical protein
MSGEAARRGGVLVQVDGARRFVPAAVAVAIAPAPQIARVPGAPEPLLGAALHDGEVIPVIAVGAARGPMLVCTYLGEKLGLVGGGAFATGFYERGPDDAEGAIRHQGETVPPLDIAPLYARVQGEGWAGRWRG